MNLVIVCKGSELKQKMEALRKVIEASLDNSKDAEFLKKRL